MIDYRRLYVSLYSRAGPYLLGSLAAYWTIKLQENKYKFSKVNIMKIVVKETKGIFEYFIGNFLKVSRNL